MTGRGRSRKAHDGRAHLLDLLILGHRGRRAPTWKRSAEEFVLEYGWWYAPAPLPATIKRGHANECFSNAFTLALRNSELTYCEGFIVLRSGGLLINHGWVTDGKGHAIDNTLAEPAGAYAGVPFQTDFVNEYYLKARAMVCLLDDWAADWPLLGELGDKPETWMEPRAQGVSRCQGCER